MAFVKLEDLRKADGSSYVIEKAAEAGCKPGEFILAATGFEHGHIYSQIDLLVKAGAVLKWVYDKDPVKFKAVQEKYPNAKPARCLQEILDDPEVHMVTSADVPCDRGPLGIQVMEAGKDYFTDKAPFTTLAQLEDAKKAVARTGRKYLCYYAERLVSECALIAGDLIHQGAIGRVLQVIGLGPHRMGDPASRPDWFFQKDKYCGILGDIGSHQCEQFLEFTGAKDAKVNFARVNNFAHPDHPGLEDFGEASFTADNGASFYFRLDWFTPDGLHSWGDGRTMVLGTDGFIELRKFIDLGTENGPNQLLLCNKEQEIRIDGSNTVGFRFFPKVIRDCLDRTENAMTQEQTFKAAELCLKAQLYADSVS